MSADGLSMSSLATQARATVRQNRSTTPTPVSSKSRSHGHSCKVSRCACVSHTATSAVGTFGRAPARKAEQAATPRSPRAVSPRGVSPRGVSPRGNTTTATPRQRRPSEVCLPTPRTQPRSPRGNVRSPRARSADGRDGKEVRPEVRRQRRATHCPQPVAVHVKEELSPLALCFAAEAPSSQAPKSSGARQRPVIPPLTLSFEADPTPKGEQAAPADKFFPVAPMTPAAAPVATPASTTARSPTSLTESALRKTQELLAQFGDLDLDASIGCSSSSDGSLPFSKQVSHQDLWEALDTARTRSDTASSFGGDSFSKKTGVVQLPVALLEMMSEMYWQLRERKQGRFQAVSEDVAMWDDATPSTSSKSSVPGLPRKASLSRLSTASTTSGSSTASSSVACAGVLSPRPPSEAGADFNNKSDGELIRDLRSMLATVCSRGDDKLSSDAAQALAGFGSCQSSPRPQPQRFVSMLPATRPVVPLSARTAAPVMPLSVTCASPRSCAVTTPASTVSLPATPMQVLRTPRPTVRGTAATAYNSAVVTPAAATPRVLTTVTHTVTTTTSVYV